MLVTSIDLLANFGDYGRADLEECPRQHETRNYTTQWGYSTFFLGGFLVISGHFTISGVYIYVGENLTQTLNPKPETLNPKP